jgi:hypothetical protein
VLWMWSANVYYLLCSCEQWFLCSFTSGWHRLYSEWATEWTIRVSNAGRRKRIFSSPNHPDRLWSVPILLFKNERSSFPGIKRLGRDVDHSSLDGIWVKNARLCLTAVDWDNFWFFFKLRVSVIGWTCYQYVVKFPPISPNRAIVIRG